MLLDLRVIAAFLNDFSYANHGHETRMAWEGALASKSRSWRIRCPSDLFVFGPDLELLEGFLVGAEAMPAHAAADPPAGA
jgi:hypothetical protein